MSSKPNSRNDKITKACQEIGFCCPYAFIALHNRPRDTNKRIANKVGLSESAIEFNKRQLKDGKLTCQEREGCKQEAVKLVIEPKSDEQ